MGYVATVETHPSGFEYCKVVRANAGTLYWTHEVRRLHDTLRDHLEQLGHRITGFQKVPPTGNMESFRKTDWADLTLRNPGNEHDLLVAYSNATSAAMALHTTGLYLEKLDDLRLSERLNRASALLVVGAQHVTSALVLHLRENAWHVNGSLVILRVALETLATSCAILLGADELVRSFQNGNWVRARESMPLLRTALRARLPTIADPEVVYSWLSTHTHSEWNAVMRNHAGSDRRLGHTDAYAALAYVGLALALLAETCLGHDGFADSAVRWPEPLPWDPPQTPA